MTMNKDSITRYGDELYDSFLTRVPIEPLDRKSVV